MSEELFVSFHPDDFAEGGLPVVGATAVLLDPKFVMFNFDKDGQDMGGARPCFSVHYIDYSDDTDYGEQLYGVGRAAEWAVTEEGQLLPLTPGKKISKSSKFFYFIQELINAGFPADRLKAGNISVIEGVVAVIGQVPYKFDGQIRKRKSKDGREFDDMVIVPTAVQQLPEDYAKEQKKGGAKSAPGAKPSAPSKPKSAPKPAPKAAAKEEAADSGISDEVLQITKDVITELVADNADGIPVKSLPAQVMKKLMKSEHRNAAIKAVVDSLDELQALALVEGVWQIEDDVVKTM